MIQDSGRVSFNLSSSHGGLIRSWLWLISVTIVNCFSVSFKECLFVFSSVDHVWTVVAEVCDAHWSQVAVSCADFVVHGREIALLATITNVFKGFWSGKVAFANVFSQSCDDFVKTRGGGGWDLFLGWENIVGSCQFRHLTLNNGEHLATSDINTARKLVLVVDTEPFFKNSDDVWLEDLWNLEITEFFFV